ncbi:hypothetical protein D3C80_934810 [compost metagenome]
MSAAKFGRYQKHASAKLRYEYFPIPSQLADLLLAATRVHLEQGHALQVVRQLPEENRLLLPGHGVGLSARLLLFQLGQQRYAIEPRPALFVTPLPASQRQHANRTLDRDVDRPVANSLLYRPVRQNAVGLSVPDEWCQCLIIDMRQR